jgi:hypothetical protein
MQSSAENIWTSAQGLLRSMLNADIYNLWFAPLKARSLEGELLTLEVANDFCEVKSLQRSRRQQGNLRRW